MIERVGRIRDADRRVAARAWTRVRRPSLPAWGWFAIDMAVGSLVASGVGELVEPVFATAGQLVQALGGPVAAVFAVVNFVRTTRGSVRAGETPGSPNSAR